MSRRVLWGVVRINFKQRRDTRLKLLRLPSLRAMPVSAPRRRVAWVRHGGRKRYRVQVAVGSMKPCPYPISVRSWSSECAPVCLWADADELLELVAKVVDDPNPTCMAIHSIE